MILLIAWTARQLFMGFCMQLVVHDEKEYKSLLEAMGSRLRAQLKQLAAESV